MTERSLVGARILATGRRRRPIFAENVLRLWIWRDMARRILATVIFIITVGLIMVQGCGSPNGYCTGKVGGQVDCDGRHQASECSPVEGCTWGLGCRRTELGYSLQPEDPCPDLPESECESSPYCTWADGCHGRRIPCSEIRNKDTCNKTAQCEWTIPPWI